MIFLQWELNLIKFFQSNANGFINFLAEAISFVGEQYTLIVILAFIYFVYNKEMGEEIAFSVFLGVCLNNALKGLIKAPRPFQVDSEISAGRESTATGYSFPSGHAQNSATFYGSIAVEFKKRYITIIVITLVFLVSLSRIYLGVHFPKDVIVGMILGFLTALGGVYLYRKFSYSLKTKMMVLLFSALAFLPFIFIFYHRDFEEIKLFRDFYTGYALFLGFIPAIYLENKYVKFSNEAKLSKKLIRFGLALIVFMAILFGLKVIIPKGYIFLDMLRYGLVSFVGMGLYPLSFKKLGLL